MGLHNDLYGYTIGLAGYHLNKQSKKPIRLALAMQVKDEQDIIELSIRYHAQKGVDKFFIMENNSSDGTLETLQELSNRYNIELFFDTKNTFSQAKNMTFLAKKAKEQGYDWVIASDADEFWYPKIGNLKQELNRRKTVIKVHSYHMQATNKHAQTWWKSDIHSINTINYDFNKKNLKADEFNIRLGPNCFKTMVNTRGLIRISGGNHSARHAQDKIKSRKFSHISENIKIFHFSIRDYEQFKKKVINIDKAITHAEKLKIRHGFGKWAILWREAYQAENLLETYHKMLIEDNCLDCLERLTVITHDDRLINDPAFQTALKDAKLENQ